MAMAINQGYRQIVLSELIFNPKQI